MSSKYDGQIVLGFKGSESGNEVSLWVKSLGEKEVTASGRREYYNVFHAGSGNEVAFMGQLATEFEQMGPYFADRKCIRIYLVGHGAFEGKTLGGKSATFLVKHLFVNTFLRGATNVGVICLMSCELAKGPSVFLKKSEKSFASTFHVLLKENAGVRTELHAYPTSVRVGVGGKKYQQDPDTKEDRRTYCKHVYYWGNNQSLLRVETYNSEQRS